MHRTRYPKTRTEQTFTSTGKERVYGLCKDVDHTAKLLALPEEHFHLDHGLFLILGHVATEHIPQIYHIVQCHSHTTSSQWMPHVHGISQHTCAQVRAC